MQIENIRIEELKPYERNTRKHTDYDVSQIAKSIELYGFNDPVGVWGTENLIVEGHGRVMAAKTLGIESVPCIRLDNLTAKQRKEYAILHNKTAELSDWDYDILRDELDELDFGEFDFDFDVDLSFMHQQNAGFNEWQKNKEAYNEAGDNEEYREFVEKFEVKHTTDDCYTPENVYEAVCEWVEKEYSLDRKNFMRPFYPGGDYQHEKYGLNAVVVDNPPFSILAEIIDFYTHNNIKFFLFCQGRTGFLAREGVCFITCGADITFENGARGNIGFATNLEREYVVRGAPELLELLEKAEKENNRKLHAELPKYTYPPNVLTAAMVEKIAARGIELKIRADEAEFVRELDSQKESGKGIYGGGFLLSDKAAADKAAGDKAAAVYVTEWTLSDREKAIIARLNQNSKERR